MKKLLVLIIVLCCTLATMDAQHKFGIRAGLNYSKFTGELELNEKYDFSSGFHFGFNYTYQLNTTVGLRAEILYTQRGTKQSIKDDAIYNLIRPISTGAGGGIVEIGQADYNMGITLAYFSFPLTAQLRVSDKFEVFGGVSLDLLFSPTGGGTMRFTTDPDEIDYLISFDNNYRTDEPGAIPRFTERQTSSQILNGESTQIYKIQAAYYNFTETQLNDRGKRFKFFDTNLVLGFNYFINSGFYLGLRGEYGLFDVTNDRMDVSLREINDNGNTVSYIYRADKDRSRSLSLSFGFRF